MGRAEPARKWMPLKIGAGSEVSFPVSRLA